MTVMYKDESNRSIGIEKIEQITMERSARLNFGATGHVIHKAT